MSPDRSNGRMARSIAHRGLATLMIVSLVFATFTDGRTLAMVNPSADSAALGLNQVGPTPTPTTTSTSANQCDGNGPENSPDQYEPGDDSITGATPITLNAPQFHTLCSTTTARDLDWIRLTADLNQTYTVRTYDLSSRVDTLLSIQGTELFLTNDDGNSSESPGASRISFTPTTAGTILIQVTQSSKTPFVTSDSDEPRAYRIVVTAETVTPTPTQTQTPTVTVTPTPTTTPTFCRDTFESDNKREDAKGLFVNKAQSRFLCGDGDVDWVWFDSVANKPYRIITADLAQGVDTVMGLYNAAGELMLFNDDYPGLGLASRIDFTSTTTTRYYVKIQDSTGHGAESFSYSLRLESDGLTNGGPCLDTFETDGTPQTAREILLGQSLPHTFCPEGDADWVRFFAVVNKTYILHTSDLSVGTDTVITIFGPDGATVMAFNDDGGGGLASRVELTAPASGTYFAQVKNAGDIGGKGQRYMLNFTASSSPSLATPIPAPTRLTATSTRAPSLPVLTPTVVTPSPTTTAGSTVDTPTATFGYTPTSLPSSTPGTNTEPEQRLVDTTLSRHAATPLPALSGFADPAFTSVWVRTDEPVRQQIVDRSWYWGDQPAGAYREPYKGSPNGRRLVQYFDKARMEMTNPDGDRSSQWFITNGLLVRELVSGQIQIGDAASDQREPAHIPLVGDGDGSGLTYASLTTIASLDGDRRVPNRVGLPVVEAISPSGKISTQSELASLATNVHYVTETGHNIPDVFWSFMQQRGPVVHDGVVTEDLVSDWLFSLGLPITEAYWTRATINGVERDVLVQAFERRILTFTPSNPTPWQVEMGNVGQHYLRWRHGH